jgi:hypothetical protein
MPTINHEKLRCLGRVHPVMKPLTEAQQAEIEGLTQRYDALIEEHGEDPSEEIAAELKDISGKIDTITASADAPLAWRANIAPRIRIRPARMPLRRSPLC